MQSPKYSLLVPVRNEVSRIEEVVHSIITDLGFKLNPIGDWEICIADDFSNDGTYEILKKLSVEFPIRLFRPSKNLGRGAIRNLLAEEARGRMLFFLDGDCQVQPGFFKAWENPDPDIAQIGKVEYNNIPKSGFNRFLGYGSGISKLNSKEKIPPAYFTSANFCISKLHFQNVNGFRTDLFGWGGEDGDLGYKLKRLNIAISYNDKAVALHPSSQNLEEYFERLIQFGRINLPVLVSENKQVAIQFKLKFSQKPWSWIFCNKLLYWILFKLITTWVGREWPFAFYRYVIFYCYSTGYKYGKKSASI